MKAPDHKKFLVDQGVNALMRAPNGTMFVGQSGYNELR